ncbi:MAG TPA: PIN domain-containing protein [Candidatus Limnocylindrales bacterium]|nr:PIN domain-containing protein [Candidatus Limnocylindrales bacterium]
MSTSGGRGRERGLVVVDTSGLIALIDRGHDLHAVTAPVVASDRGPFLLSPFVLQEIDYLVSERLGAREALSVLDEVASGAYRLEPFDARDLAVASATMKRYADMRLGLADASILVIAARSGTARVLTLDERHFRAVRPLQGGAFTILPADA